MEERLEVDKGPECGLEEEEGVRGEMDDQELTAEDTEEESGHEQAEEAGGQKEVPQEASAVI